MCAECGMMVCPGTCPNAQEETPLYECVCGEPIYEGDSYWLIDGVYYCQSCIENLEQTA